MGVLVPELVKAVIDRAEDVLVVAKSGSVVGAPTADQMKNGVVAIASAGQAAQERYMPLVHQQIGIRCVALSEFEATKLGSLVYEVLHEKRRFVERQASSDQEFLVHFFSVSSGPSLTLGETEDLKEITMILETMVGTEAVS